MRCSNDEGLAKVLNCLQDCCATGQPDCGYSSQTVAFRRRSVMSRQIWEWICYEEDEMDVKTGSMD